MINKDEYAAVYRVYLCAQPSEGEIGKHLITSDERILIFDNGLIFCYQRDAKSRALYQNLDIYRKYRESEYLEPKPPGVKFIGLKDLYYKEAVAYSNLLFSLCDSYDYYSVKELFSLIESINQLYNLTDDDELLDYDADDADD